MPLPTSRTLVCRFTCLALLLAVHNAVVEPPPLLAAEPFEAALERLRAVTAGTTSQAQIKAAWDEVAGGGVDRLIDILGSMSEVSPLAENWLRAAVDVIAERELRSAGKLPADALEKFVLDPSRAPRARRTAFEWLTRVDPAASDRLLPTMLDDASLEIRHDAVARLMSEAQQSTDDAEKLQKFQRAFQSARSLDQLKLCLEQLQKLGETPNLATEFGYVTTWKVIGPFDNTGGTGFNKAYPPETEIDFAKQYEGKNGPVKWLDLDTTDLNENLEAKQILSRPHLESKQAPVRLSEPGCPWRQGLRTQQRWGASLWINRVEKNTVAQTPGRKFLGNARLGWQIPLLHQLNGTKFCRSNRKERQNSF